MIAGIALLGVNAAEAWSQATPGLPLPPGTVVTGTVYKPPFLCAPNFVPSITTGADANDYILPAPAPCSAVPSFVAGEPAAMVVTSAPTQYVRFYCPTCSTPSVANRPFMADPSTVRGLTAAQIQDVLALPSVPTMETIVTVPAGTCVLVGIGAPAFGGHGGPAQEWAAGTPTGSNCAGLAYLPLSDYINQQPIGDRALLYEPRAGGGNAGAVAGALDRGPYPAFFTGMDLMYDSLDLLNYGDPAPLRAALVQLDGEVHASAQTVMLADSLDLREAVLGRMRQSSFTDSVGPMAALASGGPTLAYAGESESSVAQSTSNPALDYANERAPIFQIKATPPAVPAADTVYWAQGIGAWGRFEGNGDAADVRRNLAGGFAGVDRRFGPNWLAGIAAGYTNSSFSVGEPTGSADINTAHLAGYVGANFNHWNLRAAAAGSYSRLDTSRSIIFPGFSDTASARYDATTTQVFGEVGYGLAFGRIATEPFAGLAFVQLNTHGFTESGGSGIAALGGSGRSDSIGYSTFGARAATNWAFVHDMVLTPHASAAWQHAIGPITPTAALAFETNGAPFTVAGVPLARDAALVEAGLDLHLNAQIRSGIFYSGEFAGRVRDNSVRGNLNWQF